MILNSAPQNEAVLSNVGQIGEFRIRNSAKAFNILSSGLYANKIRAIIRELSCNAVDSHVAAGKADTPFDVHLPNQMEPWFSIRDYGTGLSHDQVINIYTTYFESTKTASNEFIGALGLGSKSPFSYTDNFTVTAIKDGRKGIYTAFINEHGVPSIALMTEELSEDPAGVEVKMAVEQYHDFHKFEEEARSVYTYFKLRPVISGGRHHGDFKFTDIVYERKDIVPGVHSIASGHHGRYEGYGHGASRAVMGNIAYPIDVPNAEKVLGSLSHLLRCGLEMHFGIGELDFQASREGLSYIPQTIEAIKKKLEELNMSLYTVLKAEADAVTNNWEKAEWLRAKMQIGLWQAACDKYIRDHKIPTMDGQNGRYGMQIHMKVEDLQKNYNINLRKLNKHRGSAPTTEKPYTDYIRNPKTGGHDSFQVWRITCDTTHVFVINDTKIGATERSRYHFRTIDPSENRHKYHFEIFILEPHDKKLPIKTKEFFDALHNPPEKCKVMASSLKQKEREAVARNVTILKLEQRNNGGYRRQDEMVWRDAGKADQFDANITYYYMPLVGFETQSKYNYSSAKDLYDDLRNCDLSIAQHTIYGVRKTDMEWVEKQKNWVNLEDHVAATLKRLSKGVLMSLVKADMDLPYSFDYSSTAVQLIGDDSPYTKFVTRWKGVQAFKGNRHLAFKLFERFMPDQPLSPATIVKENKEILASLKQRYPLLKHVTGADGVHIAEYVRLIDSAKPVSGEVSTKAD